MTAEICTTLAGEISIECIAETDFEFKILERAWALNGYRRANGKSKAPEGGTSGFYVELLDATPKRSTTKAA